MGFSNAGGAAASCIKSVQQFQFTGSTQAITAVDTSSTMIIQSQEAGGSGISDFDGVTLTDSTTLTRQGAGSVQMTVSVIEFDPTVINSIQAGTIVLGTGTSGTDTFTAVDTTKAFVVFNGINGTGNDSNATLNEVIIELALTNPTTATASRSAGGADSEATVHFQVIEFK